MKNVKIKNACRFGNFLKQIRNAVHIAVFYNYNLIFPKHEFLNTEYVVLNNCITLANETLTDGGDFFYNDRIYDIDKSIFTINHNEVFAIMKKILLFSTDIDPLNANDLVIHIRSGDIFTGNNPHPYYLMPPLSYYTEIIEQNKQYENIYLVTEDTLNPCINKLLELYPRINFKLQSLQEDITLILRAVNIVVSYGTFIPQLVYLSNNIKNMYCPSYFVRRRPNCETHITELSEYYNNMTPWKNTPEQNKYMIEI